MAADAHDQPEARVVRGRRPPRRAGRRDARRGPGAASVPRLDRARGVDRAGPDRAGRRPATRRGDGHMTVRLALAISVFALLAAPASARKVLNPTNTLGGTLSE